MIRVTHAFSDESEEFDTTRYRVDEGVLYVFDSTGESITHVFNRDTWAALVAVQEDGDGTVWRPSQVEPKRPL